MASRTPGEKYLDQFLDTSRPKDPEWSPESFRAKHLERCENFCDVLSQALSIPRRLGGDASPAELAADKKVLKRLLNRYRGNVSRWEGEWSPDNAASNAVLSFSEGTSTTPATFDAEECWTYLKPYLLSELGYAASQAKFHGSSKIGNKFCARLFNEYAAFADAIGAKL